MTPQETLQATTRYIKELEKAKKKVVLVGLPADKLSGKAYKDGVSVVQVGASHEYGAGVPKRSFLRVPFEIKKRDLQEFIGAQYASVLDGKSDTDKALNKVGVFATNISKEAFTNNGFGTWSPLSPQYAEKKAEAGKQNILIWSGLLRNSITWSVK